MEAGLLTKQIESAQKRIEGRNFDIRKHVLQFDDVMNQQREAVYSIRRQILEGESVQNEILERINETIENRVDTYCEKNAYPEEWNLAALNVDLKRIFGIDWSLKAEDLVGKRPEDLIEQIKERALAAYHEKERNLSAEIMRQLERNILLFVIDNRWKDHLLGMDEMKDGIYLRGYGQKDPLVEYKHEAFAMFGEMMGRMAEEVVEYVFRVEAVAAPRQQERRAVDFVHNEASAFTPAETATKAPTPVRRPQAKAAVKDVGRNDPCPCGSGKKYKKCCGKEA